MYVQLWHDWDAHGVLSPVYKSSLVSYHQLSIFKSVYFAPDDNSGTKKSYKKKKTIYVMSHEAIANKVRIIYGVH